MPTHLLSTMNIKNPNFKVMWRCFNQSDIYELEAKAAMESNAKPRSICGDPLLSIKFDLWLTAVRHCVARAEAVIYAETW